MSDFSKEIDDLESIFTYPYGHNDFEFAHPYEFDFTYQPVANDYGQVVKKEVALLRGGRFLKGFKLFLLKRQASEVNRAYAAGIAIVNKYRFTALIGFTSEMEAIKKEVETLIDGKTEIPPGTKSKHVSFQWKKKELSKLYKNMVGNFISPDTTIDQFKAIFNGQSIESLIPIKWHDNNASEVLYFVLKLQELNLIEYNKRMDYKQLTACFSKPDGKPFTAKFKELKQTIGIKLTTYKQKAINDLLKGY